MWTPDFFFNPTGRLRSGWRLSIFIVLFLLLVLFLAVLLRIALHVLLVSLLHSKLTPEALFDTAFGYVAQGGVMLVAATLAGWACGALLEDVPLRALGWSLHAGWWRDLLKGALFGLLALGVAVLILVAVGGLRFSVEMDGGGRALARTLLYSGIVFTISAAAEEATFRGYSLQTLLRSQPIWIAVLPSSIFFAAVHLSNPHVAPVFTFVNTVLAGVWLAVAYMRTRSLWFPLGLHWSWNWTMGAVLGLPVSGITKLTPAPLLNPHEQGQAWLTGGGYGPEGGAACTIALVVSTLFIWRTSLLQATPELKRFTDEELPAPTQEAFIPHDEQADRNDTPGDAVYEDENAS